MAVLTPNKSTSGTYERKQVVRLQRGMYGGMLARYSMPKEYTSDYGTKEKMTFGFVITHDKADRQLPKFSGAFIMPNYTLYYDPNNPSKTSTLVNVLYALHGGKRTKEQIADTEAFDADEYIGRPVELLIEPSDKPNKDGLFSNRIKAIEPANKELIAAIKPLWSSKNISTNETTGLKYLASPAEEFEDDAAPVAQTDDLSFDDEAPF